MASAEVLPSSYNFGDIQVALAKRALVSIHDAVLASGITVDRKDADAILAMTGIDLTPRAGLA
jgi:hypothetical protein